MRLSSPCNLSCPTSCLALSMVLLVTEWAVALKRLISRDSRFLDSRAGVSDASISAMMVSSLLNLASTVSASVILPCLTPSLLATSMADETVVLVLLELFTDAFNIAVAFVCFRVPSKVQADNKRSALSKLESLSASSNAEKQK